MSQQGTMQPRGSWRVVGGAEAEGLEERRMWCVEDSSQLGQQHSLPPPFLLPPHPTPHPHPRLPGALQPSQEHRWAGRIILPGPPPLVSASVHMNVLFSLALPLENQPKNESQ